MVINKLPRVPATAQQDEAGSWATTQIVRKSMLGNKSRDTRPEKALRSAIHALGFRYRVSVRPLPHLRRTADLVFAREHVAVFLDGCFWHGCPDHCRAVKTNAEYWSQKIVLNRLRDEDTDRQLVEAGWQVVRIWEHDPTDAAAQRVAEVVRIRRTENATP